MKHLIVIAALLALALSTYAHMNGRADSAVEHWAPSADERRAYELLKGAE